MTKPLSGIRVLDFSQLLPGPLCTQHLADMGAEVLKIENRTTGDAVRFSPNGELSMLFLLLNRNKRSLSVDLRQEAGVALVHKLVKDADIVVEGFRPGVMARLDMSYETLHTINPRLVYCSITGYGQTGPYIAKGGHDINYQGYAGILDQSGAADGVPAQGNFQIADLAGGTLSAVMGILAALFDAQRSGHGRHVDVSMTDCAMAHNIMPMAALQSYGEGRPLPRGDDYTSGRLPCYGVYETADGRYLALGAIEPHFWQNFCAAVERPDLLPRGFALGEEAPAARAEIAELIKSRNFSEWSALLENVDGCTTPVLRLDEAIEHPNTKARGMIVDCEHPEMQCGNFRQYAFPIKMSDFEFGIERRPPLLGEHNNEVLAELGYGAEEIAELRKNGVA